jgi:cell division protein ZapB
LSSESVVKLLNLLTEIRLHHYSGEMISEFQLLSEKITQLAALTRSLRHQNAELRLDAAALAAENVDLTKRIEEAHLRVTALLEKIPTTSEQDEEPV